MAWTVFLGRHFNWPLLLLIIFSVFPIFSNANSISYGEWSSLKDIYNSTNGDYWIWKPASFGRTWNFSSFELNDPCQNDWQGVVCTCTTPTACVITSLNLNSYNLSGYLPSHVGNLSALQYFSLYNNKIEGRLPIDLFQLPQIQYISFHSNYFEDILPQAYASSVLNKLDLSYNRMYGTVPYSTLCTTFGANLEYLMLQANNFTGSFASNDLVGCQVLKTLNMSFNSLTGTLPPDLFIPVLNTIQGVDVKFNGRLTGNLSCLNYSFPSLLEADLNSNYFTGSIPSELFRSPLLKFFNSSTNEMTGTIPTTLAEAKSLEQLFIGTNIGITGKLTQDMWGPYLPQNLIALDVQVTSLEGNLTSVLPLVHVQNLNVKATKFTGSIPPELCQMQDLITFVIAINDITGTIPKQILSYPGNGIPNNGSCLKNMSFFITFRTQLEGSLPLDLSPMPLLNVLSIGSCFFDGPLPKTWPQSITKIVMHSNYFTGHISPTQFSTLPHLYQLSISSNALTGTWDKATNVTWVNAKKLLYFQIHGNFFHGEIFPLVSQFPNLLVLTLGNNSFTGEIIPPVASATTPCPWCNMTMMFLRMAQFTGKLPKYLYTSQPFVNTSHVKNSVVNIPSNFNVLFISINYFTGAIPSFHYESNTNLYISANSSQNPTLDIRLNLTKMTVFRVDTNHFSGPADTFFFLPNAEILTFDQNYFTGRLPNFLPSKIVFDIKAADNLFTGPFPSIILQKQTISVALLNANQFTGDIASAIQEAPLLPFLDTFDVSENYLTGFIPWNVIRDRMPRMRVFSAATNCISSPLTSQICSNDSNLEELVLDGLRSAVVCRSSLLVNSKSFILKEPTPAGPIPSCIFGLPKIQVLHLAGNLMYGSLPSDDMVAKGELNVSDALTTLVVSNNVLTGTIPLWVQHRMWGTLVLSNNRFTGVLSDDFNVFTAASGTIRLDVNRLSGFVPEVIVNAKDINILSGNLFDCNEMTRSDLPPNDPSYDSYTCGSAPTNNAMTTWVAIVGTMVAAFLVSYILIRRSLIKQWNKNAQADTEEQEDSNNSANNSTCNLIIESFWRNWLVWFFPTSYDDVVLIDVDDACDDEKDIFDTVRESIIGGEAHNQMTVAMQRVDNILQLSSIYRNIRVLIFTITCLLICVFIPVYVTLSLDSHTLAYEYIWSVSGIYMSGLNTSAVMLAMYSLLIIFCWMWIIFARRLSGNQGKSQSLPHWWYLGYMAGNITLNVLVDVAYVLVLIHASSTTAVGYAIALAVCKTILNIVVIEWWFVRMKRNNASRLAKLESMEKEKKAGQISDNDDIELSNTIQHIQENPIHKLQNRPTRKKVTKEEIMLDKTEFVYNIDIVQKLVLNTHDYTIIIVTFLVNSLWIPFLSSVWVSPNCFSNVLNPPPTFDGQYTIEETLSSAFSDDLDLPKTLVSVHTVTYDAPFVYSYNCASTIVSYFVPSFVFQSIIQTCIIPVVHLLLFRLFTSLRKQGWEATLGVATETELSSLTGPEKSKAKFMDWIFNILPSRYRFMIAIDDDATLMRLMKRYFSKEGHKAHHKDSISSVIYLTDRFLPAKLYHFLSLCLCFGAIFPLLSIPVCIASVVMTWMEERLVYRVWGWSQSTIRNMHGMRASSPLEHQETVQAKAALAEYIQQNLEIELTASKLFFAHPRLIFFVLAIISPILSFLLYDTAGDESTNWRNGLSVAMPLLMFPLLLYVIRKYVVRRIGLLPTVIHWEKQTVSLFERTVSAVRERSVSLSLSPSAGAATSSSSSSSHPALKSLSLSDKKNAIDAVNVNVNVKATTQSNNNINNSSRFSDFQPRNSHHRKGQKVSVIELRNLRDSLTASTAAAAAAAERDVDSDDEDELGDAL